MNSANGYKFVVSTKYDSFEENESYYYELRTDNDSVVIEKTWFLGTGRKNHKLTEFKSGAIDSIIYLNFLNSILVAYDLNSRRELEQNEIKNLLEELN